MSAAIWTIVVAGGSGERFGAAKQFVELAGRSVLTRAVDAARPSSTGIIVVVPAATVAEVNAASGVGVVVVPGGATRAASVRAGLAAVPADAGIVVVHDAARPLASPSLFRAVIEAVARGADGAIPGVAVADTIKRVEGTQVVATLDRSELVAVQTPQAFRADVLRRAHAGEPEATDDAGLLERIGFVVAVVPGESRNIKLTSVGDLALLAFLCDDPGVEKSSSDEPVRA